MYRASLPLAPRGTADRSRGELESDVEPTLSYAMSSPSVCGDGLESQMFALGSPQVVRLGSRQSAGPSSVKSSSDHDGGMRRRSFCMSDTDSMAGSLVLGQSQNHPRGPPDFCTASAATLPNCFRCPISRQPMEDPVLADDGRAYERTHLVAQGYTGQLQANTALKSALEGYLDLQAKAEQRGRDWQEYISQQEQKVVRELTQRKQQVRELRGALELSQRRAVEQAERKQAKSVASTATPSEMSAPSEGCPEMSPTWAGGPAPRPQVRNAKPVKELAPRSSTWARLCQSVRPGVA